jgi:hypothetical protein
MVADGYWGRNVRSTLADGGGHELLVGQLTARGWLSSDKLSAGWWSVRTAGIGLCCGLRTSDESG